MSSIDDALDYEASERDTEMVLDVDDHISYSLGDDDYVTGIIKGFSPEGCPIVIDDDDDDDAMYIVHDNVRLID